MTTALPEKLFANPVWHALHTTHRDFLVSATDACRYPADVVPFAAVAAPDASAMRQLESLLSVGESVWLTGDHYTQNPNLRHEQIMECFQMVLPETVASPPTPAANVLPLANAHAHEMVALTDIAFPALFRRRTCEMGSYYGVRSPTGDLIAMGGERLKIHHFSELSAVCTHPQFRGQGLATAIMWEIIRRHRRDRIVSWLHVACANRRAIDLYLHMGFEMVRQVTLHRISRLE
jgi:GNAT superfamily N-acetyltransferase